MNTSTCALQCGHLAPSAREGAMAISRSQALHLKCIMGLMRAFLVMLLVAASLHAQTVADAARSERARRAQLKPAQVIKADGAPPVAATPKADEGKKPEVPPKTLVDPVKEYNDQMQKLRARVQSLMDDEAATLLQINDLTNQINAPVVDQATKDQAIARLGDSRQKLAVVRLELDQARKAVDAMQAVGPPRAQLPPQAQTPPPGQTPSPGQTPPQTQAPPPGQAPPQAQMPPQALPQR